MTGLRQRNNPRPPEGHPATVRPSFLSFRFDLREDRSWTFTDYQTDYKTLTPDWIAFLHGLGRHLAQLGRERPERCGAVVSLPCLDYGSCLVASGVISATFADHAKPDADISSFENRIGEAVSFPYRKHAGTELRLFKGVVKGLDVYQGAPRLLVTYVEEQKKNRKTETRAVENRWLPLIRPLSGTPSLQNKARGSLLAENIESLEAVVGQRGVITLLRECHSACCILDTKVRVRTETKQAVDSSRLGIANRSDKVVLRDLVRLASEGPEAMAETFCCQIFGEPEPEWPVTVLAGSLNFLRGWDDCDSKVRIALVSPIENAYGEAIREANDLFVHREGEDIHLPEVLSQLKPEAIDYQIFYSD